MRTALFYGTFDPVTNGHVWLAARAVYLDLFERVVVGVMCDPARATLFTPDERVWMWRETVRGIHPERVEVVNLDDEVPVRAARRLGCQFLLRGVQSAQEYEAEVEAQQINHGQDRTIQPVFLLPNAEVADCSSTLVRGMIGKPGWKDAVKEYVPVTTWEALIKRFGRPGAAGSIS